jgi:hypothetical protein
MSNKIKESSNYDSLIGVKCKESNPLLNALGSDAISEAEEDKEWKKHWKGMPEFEQEKNKPYKTLYLHFRNEKDYQEFAELVNQKLTEKTKTIWYPKLDLPPNSAFRWIEDD